MNCKKCTLRIFDCEPSLEGSHIKCSKRRVIIELRPPEAMSILGADEYEQIVKEMLEPETDPLQLFFDHSAN